MSQVNNIRDLRKKGSNIKEISEITHTDPKTVRKYLEQDNFSPMIPVHSEQHSKLDPFKSTIAQWLAEDKKIWRKQQYTAIRIYHLLQEKEGYTGSYNLVQRYVKKIRKREKERQTLELIWEPGSAQVDFGEADFMYQGKRERLKYLVVSFPYSNDSYAQIFHGENAECVCTGLQAVFEFIGGVPRLLVFDNATGIGHRIQNGVRETELFSQFHAHYGFVSRFCTPYAGHEKGNVENKVRYIRNNLFVPVPAFDDREAFNRQLLTDHEKKAAELHYKKQTSISDLFKEDLAACYPLPTHSFHVCRYVVQKTDGYGKVCFDGKHWYSTRPESAKQQVLIGLMANDVEILDYETGEVITRHARQYGPARTDSYDYSTTIAMLLKNCGAWHNSGLRLEIPDMLRDYMDNQSRPQLRGSLHILQQLTETYGLTAATEAMEKTIQRGTLNPVDTEVLAGRIAGYGIQTPPEPGPALEVYDEVFLKGAANHADTSPKGSLDHTN
jgi:transposase